MKKTIVIAGFPGIGKSECIEKKEDLIFQGCYDANMGCLIDGIKSNIGKVDIIFVSTRVEVTQALFSNNIPFIYVYPNIELKDEYVGRIFDEETKKYVIDNWHDLITEIDLCENDKIALTAGQYISDIIDYIKIKD